MGLSPENLLRVKFRARLNDRVNDRIDQCTPIPFEMDHDGQRTSRI